MELVLNTYGVCLNRDNEGFVISHGGEKQRIPTEGITSILISKGAQITSDAVMLAIEREIEVIFAQKDGTPIGRIWSPKYGSISTIRKGQLSFTYSHEAVIWIKQTLKQKLTNQQALLLTMQTHDVMLDSRRTKYINKLSDYQNKINNIDGDIVNDIASQLRGWEGQASRIYFECLNLFLPDKYRFPQRSQHPAMDITNALLNYGYGLLYTKIESALIKTGIDPYIGILHRDDYNRPVLVYDIIELYRVWVDYVVFSLLCQNVITEEYYSFRSDGSCWLESLGRRVLIQSFNDYMEEAIQLNGITRGREHQIYLYVQQLAQQFKLFNSK